MEKPTLSWMYAAVFVLAFGVFGLGFYFARTGQTYALLAAGCVCVVAVLLAAPLMNALCNATSQEGVENQFRGLNNRLDQLTALLTLISEQQLISDRTKGIAFRDRDRDTLRRAIQEDISRGDWEAALALVGDIEIAFGGKQEADRLRQEIRAIQGEAVRRQINEVVAVIDKHVQNEQWPEALREAQRLQQAYPNDDQVRQLPMDIEARRQNRKQQLLNEFNAARARNDNDGSIEILRQLDLYLTPEEAASLQESARTIFRERIHILRQQFTLAVQDDKWDEAVRVGQEIIDEFPNSRVAQEVREKMPVMREKAAKANGKKKQAAEV